VAAAAPGAAADRLAFRPVLASAAGYWLFFVALMTARSVLINPWAMQGRLLALRLLVAAVSAGLTLALWLALRGFDGRPLGRRVAVAALGCAAAALAFALVNGLVYRDVPPCGGPPPAVAGRAMMTEADCHEALATLVAEHLVTGYFLMATWAALYLALGYAGQVGAWERRAAALAGAARTAELRALRYQVNPHFLFNTLNALSSLVLTRDHEAAEEMIAHLSTYYRASLAFDPERDVALADEVELQRLYLLIEAQRFPHRLRAAFDVPPALADARVPGMVLQPLVENAVKHGVARSRAPVTIRIVARTAADRLVLEVADDAAPGGATATGAGIGLRNVADRLAARHDAAAECRAERPAAGGFRVVLTLPLVRDAG